jgi:hypothetical protein
MKSSKERISRVFETLRGIHMAWKSWWFCSPSSIKSATENATFSSFSSVYLDKFFIVLERKLQPNEFPHNLYIQNYSTATATCITLRKWLFSLSKETVLHNNEAIVNFLFWQVSVFPIPVFIV